MSLEENNPAAAEANMGWHAAQLGPVPARYTIGVHQSICDNIRKGNRPITAAQMSGIPSNTFYQWMRLGKAGNPHLAKFVEDVELAGGDAEGKALASVVGAFDDPDNAKWYLERTRAAGYSKEVNEKLTALLNEFMDRLQDGLPQNVFDMVLAVASGAGLPEGQRARIQLVANNDTEIA